MNDPFWEMSPAEVAAMTKRLEFTNEPVEPIETGPSTELAEFPTSIKLPRELKKACKARADSLNMQQSVYIRSLIERDIAESGTGKQSPEWAREILAVVARHQNDDEHRQAS